MAMVIFQNIHAIDVAMAGILSSVFSKGMYTLKDPENVSKFKTLVNHSGLYFGLIVYTTIGAKVMRINLLKTQYGWIFFRFFKCLSYLLNLMRKRHILGF